MVSLTRSLALLAFSFSFLVAPAQSQPALSGTFVLYKFANPIGKETYSIENKNDQYRLTSDFLFTDRGSPVPLKTGYSAKVDGMVPQSYTAKGRVSRPSQIDDTMTVNGDQLTVTHVLGGQNKSETFPLHGEWFLTEGYAPVSMQEQMMRWWLLHHKPAEFTVYPAAAKVHIAPAETLTVNGHTTQGYTVNGLIWG